MMQSAPGSNSPAKTGRDLFFHCQHCGVRLVVDASAAGLTLNCQRCGKPTMAPAPVTAALAPAVNPPGQQSQRVADLQRQLKENESQRTEVNGHINQLSIQVHRWQLRLQTLEQRHQELAAELASFAGSR